MSHALSDALLELRPGDDIGLGLGEILSVELLGSLGCAQVDSSQFVRLSRVLVECFAYSRGIPGQPLESLCQVANSAEELFWSCSANQWLRTKIISEKHPNPNHLFPFGMIETQPSNSGFSSIAFHSNFVPCHPDWRNVGSGRGEGAGVARRRLCFPSHVLEDVLSGDKSLVERLNELRERNAKSAVVNSPAHDGGGGNEESKPLWEIGPHEFDIVDTTIASGDKVWKISWRGGIFIMKNFKIPEVDDDDDDDDDFETSDVIQPFDRELEVVRRLSHPHIVYSFGMSKDEKQKSLWMEALDLDLFSLIEERGRLTDCSEPPFSPLHTLDILLQIARAMTHMHELPEPVIHGDLKPQNIFVLSHDELEGDILGGVCEYYVKVADFGSARILRQNPFEPDRGTTRYLAPEVLLAFSQQYRIEFPKKIDVYSFGILAFQVLTGLEPYEGKPLLQVKEEVILGTCRPSLQEACRRRNFVYDPELVDLVERCWHHEASARPEFSDVTTELVGIYENLNQINQLGWLATTESPSFKGSDDGALCAVLMLVRFSINATFSQNLMDGAPALRRPEANAGDGGVQTTEIRRRRRASVLRKLLRCACSSSGAVKGVTNIALNQQG